MVERGLCKMAAPLAIAYIGFGCGVSLTVLPDQAIAQPRVEIALSLSYGAGPDVVGVTRLGEPDSSAPPTCPAMFQMTSDGSLWVLDTVNSRILAFRAGKQVLEIPTHEFRKRPSLFGVTRDSVWVEDVVNDAGIASTVFLRYDRLRSVSEVLRLEPPPDGGQFDPLDVAPLGPNDSLLLMNGVRSRDSAVASIVMGQDGKVVSRLDGDARPGADGHIWRLRRTQESQSELSVVVEKYAGESATWLSAAKATLPKCPELSKLREKVITRFLGVDECGSAVGILFEGRPLRPTFFRISPSGAAPSTFALEDAGWNSAPLGKYFSSEHYQLLPDGSVLAQYATPENYRILRISF